MNNWLFYHWLMVLLKDCLQGLTNWLNESVSYSFPRKEGSTERMSAGTDWMTDWISFLHFRTEIRVHLSSFWHTKYIKGSYCDCPCRTKFLCEIWFHFKHNRKLFWSLPSFCRKIFFSSLFHFLMPLCLTLNVKLPGQQLTGNVTSTLKRVFGLQ